MSYLYINKHQGPSLLSLTSLEESPNSPRPRFLHLSLVAQVWPFFGPIQSRPTLSVLNPAQQPTDLCSLLGEAPPSCFRAFAQAVPLLGILPFSSNHPSSSFRSEFTCHFLLEASLPHPLHSRPLFLTLSGCDDISAGLLDSPAPSISLQVPKGQVLSYLLLHPHIAPDM